MVYAIAYFLCSSFDGYKLNHSQLYCGRKSPSCGLKLIFCSVHFVKSRIALTAIVNLLLVLVLFSALFMSRQTPYDEDLYEYKIQLRKE